MTNFSPGSTVVALRAVTCRACDAPAVFWFGHCHINMYQGNVLIQCGWCDACWSRPMDGILVTHDVCFDSDHCYGHWEPSKVLELVQCGAPRWRSIQMVELAQDPPRDASATRHLRNIKSDDESAETKPA